MNDCKDLELLVSLRASGAPDALDPAEAARLDAHLASCAGCRVELEASEAALDLARLPAPSEAERRATRDLPVVALAALRRSDRRRGLSRRALAGVAGVAVAAGLAAALASPALFRKDPQVPAALAVAAQAWQEPDLDELWSDASVVDLDTSAPSDGDGTEAALAALEY